MSSQTIEYHRNAAALVPEADDPDPGLAVLVLNDKKEIAALTCNCRAYEKKKKRNCPHKKALAGMVKPWIETMPSAWFDEGFRQGPWHRLAAALENVDPVRGDVRALPVTDADTVVMNPPFGAQNEGADRPFLRAAANVADVAYTVDVVDERLLVRDVPPRDIGAVVDAVEAAGGTCDSLAWTEPDLEDVYLALAGDEEGVIDAVGDDSVTDPDGSGPTAAGIPTDPAEESE